MDKAINEFKDKHALLLTEIRRLKDASDESLAARTRELRSILKVVARSYLREEVDPAVTEDQLTDWLTSIEAA